MVKPKDPEVLVVEDEFATRMVAADAISDMGLCVREASDVDEALQALDDHPDIGVLFTDIQMPGSKNGLDLVEQVHGARPAVELIVTSGGTNVQDSELPDDGTFISKPYSTSRLAKVIEQKVISRSKGRSLDS